MARAAEQSAASVYVISRQRLLNDSNPTRILRKAEADLIAKLQGLVDNAKASFAVEEVELTRRRAEFSPKEMNARAADFDSRVRLTRRSAQEQAKAVQTAFQEARAKLVIELAPVLEKLRIEVGAVAILDSDQVLAIDPKHDLTERALLLVNQMVKPPVPPTIEITLDLPPPKFPLTPRAPEKTPGKGKE